MEQEPRSAAEMPPSGGYGASRARYLVPLSVLVAMLLTTFLAGVYGLNTVPAFDRLVRGLHPGIFLSLCVLFSTAVFIMLIRFVHSRELLIETLSELRRQLEEQRAQLALQNKDLIADTERRAAELVEKVTELERSRTAMVSILEDLTESRDRIAEASAFDNAILTSLSDGLVVVDTKGKIIRCNATAMQINKTPDLNSVGMPGAEVFNLVDADGKPLPFEKRTSARVIAMGANAVPLRETAQQLLLKDGSLVPIELEASPVIANGALVAVVILFRDVTEQRRIDRSKSEFVSLASHQLRTPLTAIGWYAELLLSDEAPRLTTAGKEYLREIYLSNRRMVDLVDALLNVSRIEMGNFSVEPKPVDLATLITEETNAFVPLVTEKNLNVQTEIMPGMPPYSADPKLMAIVIQNLVSNAIKYTPVNGSVRIGCSRDPLWVTLTVSDTGIGIPPEEQKGKIFRKMYRASNAQVMEAEGSGLGLYLVKSIVDQVGGSISYTSEVDKGTTFTVKLPAVGMAQKAGSRPLVTSARPRVPGESA